MALVSTNISTGLDYRFLNFAATLQNRATGYQNVFGTSWSIYSITIINITASGEKGILKLYDTTATVTPGTTVPSHCLPFTYSDGSSGGTTTSANSTTYIFPDGLPFANGVGVAVSEDIGGSSGAGYGTTTGAANLGATVTSCVIAYK